jgi:outer membrane receptor protein involved in Fe transport
MEQKSLFDSIETTTPEEIPAVNTAKVQANSEAFLNLVNEIPEEVPTAEPTPQSQPQSQPQPQPQSQPAPSIGIPMGPQYMEALNKLENFDPIKNTKVFSITLPMSKEEVEVTAQARGQLSAINEQLSANEIKNVVSKDRIRELPDANAAESVARLPGVSIVRYGGEGAKVVIRGLSPKYNKIMVDGVQMAATGSGDRSVNMSMISSYSLEGIEVIKSPTANMDANQVGGAVNFKMKTAEKGLITMLLLKVDITT